MHRTPKKRRMHKAMVTAAAAAGLSGTLVLGHALDNTAEHLDVALAATVFGIGGRGDPDSARVQDKLNGEVGPGFTTPPSFEPPDYIAIHYPASFNFQKSTNEGVTTLEPLVLDAGTSGPVQISSYSEGTLVAEQVKRDLAAGNYPGGTPYPGGSDNVTFLFIASPYVPNGGLFARHPGFGIPGIVPTFSPAEPTAYNSTYVTNEYDPYADAPAYLNPASAVNSLMAIKYAHPDQYYDDIDPNADQGVYTTIVDNGAGGTDTYILVYNPELPLFGPVRQLEDNAPQLKPLLEPIVSSMEPLFRVMVDMGYTDRTNENPATPTPYSLITPPEKIKEALRQIPGALAQGRENFKAGHDVTEIPESVTKPGPTPPPIQNKLAPALVSPPDPKPTPNAQDNALDKLVIKHPKVGSGKSAPTTTAPTTGSGHGSGAKLLKRVTGGASTPTAPSARSDPDAPKTHHKPDGHSPKPGAAA